MVTIFNGVVCAGVGYIFYHAYRTYINPFDTISNASQPTINELITHLEPSTSKFVKLHGKVVCLQPIKYTRSDNKTIDVAIYEKQIEQINETWSTTSQYWIRNSKFTSSTISTSPLAMHDPGYQSNTKNYINIAIDGATQMNKLVASKVFKEAERAGFWKTVFDLLLGNRMLGYITTEKIVICGTDILAIGEVTKYTDGYTEIHKPKDGKPYYLIFGNEFEILDSFYSSARWRWILGILFTSIGVAIIGYIMKQYLTKLWISYRDAIVKRTKTDEEFKNEITFLVDRNNLENDKLCIICKDNDSNIVLLNCGHFGFCEECAVGLNLCPICRKVIAKKQKIFVI